MRSLNTLSTAAGVLALGNVEFLKAGQRCIIAAVDSVATATIDAQYAGSSVATGPLPIEPGTDQIRFPDNIVTQFIAMANGQLQITLGGTVAGCRVNVLVLAPGEPTPW